MKLLSTHRRGWVLLAFTIGAFGILLTGGLSYILSMPGKSYTGPLPPITPEEAQVRNHLTSHVQTLAGDIGERNIWRFQSLLAAADYIEHTFAQSGYWPRHERYESRGKPVYNVIAEKLGSSVPEEIVLIGAHYDTVQGGPGANDNGSGVAALLELARLLADRELPRTVRFVAFVNEERPFAYSQEMGSVVDAQRAKERGDRIQAMISLETIGYYSDARGSQHYPFPLSWFYPSTANFVGFVGNLASRKLVHSTLRSFRRQTQFPAEGAAVPAWVKGVGWSDHWSFWQAGYQAIMVTDTAFFRYAHYHAGSDTPDKLDYARTARVVVGLTHVISDLASEPKRPSDPESMFALSPLLSSLLASAVAAGVSTSHDPNTHLRSWTWTHGGISLRLAQLLPDQTRAFFLGRGFAEDVADRVARSCVLQTIFRNDGAKVVEYDLASWAIIRPSERLTMRTREVWDREWQAQGIAVSPRIAFRWSLLPTTQRYEPGDYNWGMTSFGLPPGERFDLSLTIKVDGEPVSAMIPSIQCANDR